MSTILDCGYVKWGNHKTLLIIFLPGCSLCQSTLHLSCCRIWWRIIKSRLAFWIPNKLGYTSSSVWYIGDELIRSFSIIYSLVNIQLMQLSWRCIACSELYTFTESYMRIRRSSKCYWKCFHRYVAACLLVEWLSLSNRECIFLWVCCCNPTPKTGL